MRHRPSRLVTDYGLLPLMILEGVRNGSLLFWRKYSICCLHLYTNKKISLLFILQDMGTRLAFFLLLEEDEACKEARGDFGGWH